MSALNAFTGDRSNGSTLRRSTPWKPEKSNAPGEKRLLQKQRQIDAA